MISSKQKNAATDNRAGVLCFAKYYGKSVVPIR